MPRSAYTNNGRPKNATDVTALSLTGGLAGVTLSDVGASFDRDLSLARWAELLALFGRIGRAAHWWIGDAINHGEAAYGTRYTQYLNVTGYRYQTLANLAYTARQIPLSRRRENVDFSHHAEVAALPAPVADRILQIADPSLRDDKQPLAVAEVRDLVRQAQRQDAADAAPPMPDGLYSVILADPPWRHDVGTTDPSRAIELQHYATMSLDAICALPLPAIADDAVLFLWATAPLLPEALEVMSEWGFTYRTGLVWDKERIGLGYWVRGRHEHLLVGTCGNPHPPETALRPESVVRAARGAHSAKPPVIHEIIGAMFPGASKIELFARQARPGWDVWGAEAAAPASPEARAPSTTEVGA